ncbi:hypothetical protein ZWY2020_011499 [Hordeum vulgare]|nr:hypothetical protein ZWY2020_011499 [Hordeum vulgare]
MAAVLDALAARVMNIILDMGEEKISMLLGVSQEINKLKANVEPLRNLLTDAERRRITDRSVQAWVTMLKSAMYEASDILDLCQLEAMDRKDKRQHSSGLCLRLRAKLPFLGCMGEKLQVGLQPFLFCVQNPRFANEVGSRIKNLNEELATIYQGAANFKFIDLASYEERRRPPTSSTSYPRRENAQFVQSDLVGEEIKKNTEQLEHKLIADSRHEHGSSAVRVVAIVGQGGIGKSTLAKKVFASEAIKEEFKTKIWLSVTQQFTPMDLLRAAISQAGGKHGDEKDETMLVNALTDTLSNNKFLLVMDDVWNQQAWENVLRTPVLNAAKTQPGSRVLVTSRKVDVVRSMGASILRVDTLNDEDAWCLLKKQLPLPQPQVGVQRDFDELKDIGMKIVKKCDGLPLAIKVMGGLLSKRDPKEHDWEIVLHKYLGWEEEGGSQVKTDRGWCSLEELEALSHLRILSVQGLENVAGSSVAKRAKISNKKNLEYLELSCYNYKDDEDEAEEEVRQIGMEQQEIIEAVFDELCPPPARLETLIISRYFGRRLPNWLQSPAATTFKSLKDIDLLHITYCTRLPDGLGRIHGLEELRVIDAPGIEHVGPDFQTHDAARGDGGVAFPNLRTLSLDGLSGWKEWDWEDEEQSKVIAMPALEFLFLRDCKLTHLPSGLASDRRQNLRSIVLEKLTLLEYVENFPWVVELKVYSCPELKRISGLSKLRTVDINSCPKLKLLEGVRALDSLELDWKHWEVSAHQAGRPRELPQDFVISR